MEQKGNRTSAEVIARVRRPMRTAYPPMRWKLGTSSKVRSQAHLRSAFGHPGIKAERDEGAFYGRSWVGTCTDKLNSLASRPSSIETAAQGCERAIEPAAIWRLEPQSCVIAPNTSPGPAKVARRRAPRPIASADLTQCRWVTIISDLRQAKIQAASEC